MCRRLAHRGPDEEGVYERGGTILGQRRLSIIDLVSGRQPIGNEEGSIWVVFNGEIYNYQLLRTTLESKGHVFETQSDTEVIVHAYEEYGRDCVDRLRGMFAFAVWDEQEQTLLLARDRLGKKPLFYTRTTSELVFASELQALVQHPAVARRIDLKAVDDYLTYGYIPAPQSIFQAVYKLLPGHTLTFRLRSCGNGTPEVNVEPYWQLEYRPKLNLTEEEAAEQLLEKLTEAVRLRMIADVPLGALLSGGVDSSIVVALMSRLSSRPLKTFSIGFSEQAFNELPYARLVASYYETDHHELIVEPKALNILPTLVAHYGEPYADSSAIPSYHVAQMTGRHVKVALNGDGGDESFAGYSRYAGMQLTKYLRGLPKWLRRGAARMADYALPSSLPRSHKLRHVQRFLETGALPRERQYLHWMSYFSPKDKEDLYAEGFSRQLNGHDAGQWLIEKLTRSTNGAISLVDHMLDVDVQSYLPYDLLVKMDIASMAHSVEMRSPFLDHEVMQFCAQLPPQLKLRGRRKKYLLKLLGSNLLPPAIMKRRKMGFGVPLNQWMRGELIPLLHDTLLSPQSRLKEYFRVPAIEERIQQHWRGKKDHSYQLWALLWLEMWHREFID